MSGLRRSAFALGAGFVPALPTAAVAQYAQDNSAGQGAVVLFLLALVVLGIILYFLPSFIAFKREHPNRWPIFLINLVFGSTLLGWIGALIWALNAIHRPQYGSYGGESGLNIFANDVKPVRIEPTDYRQSPPPVRNDPWAPEPPAGSRPPVRPETKVEDIPARLQRLKALRDAGSLEEDEYQRLRKPLLDAYLNRP